MKLNEIIAENLRVGMALKNLSVGEIAKETGLSINTVSGVKNNREKRKLSTLAKISQYLGITVKDLVTENTFLTEVN